jgi:histidinol-phosphate aminotransferase
MIKAKEHLAALERTPTNAEPSRFGKIRLDRNDRNQPFGPAFMARIRERLTDELIMAYPECWPVFQKTAVHIGVPVDHVLLHMGSEQAIKLVFETYIRPGDKVLLHLPGYAMYPVFARLYQAEVESQPCDSELGFDWEQYLGRIQPGLRMVVLENPNGFLGNPVDMGTVERIVAKAQSCGALALVDEAYYLFHRETAVPLLEKYDNLVITRSFSKAFGLAGLRAGCLISRPENIKNLTKLKPAYELTSVTAMILEELLDHPEEYEGFAQETRNCLADFKAGVEALGFATSNSVANFLTIRLGRDLAEAWRNELAKRNMLIRRPFREEHLRDWVRISTASPALQEQALQVLRDIINAR